MKIVGDFVMMTIGESVGCSDGVCDDFGGSSCWKEGDSVTLAIVGEFVGDVAGGFVGDLVGKADMGANVGNVIGKFVGARVGGDVVGATVSML